MDYQLEIHHLDVGQGDSTLIVISSDGQLKKTVLIDCGPCASSPRVIQYCKKHLNANPLDIFIISHLHKDHMGSYASVIEQLHPVKIHSTIKRSASQPSHPVGWIPRVGEEILQLPSGAPEMTCIKDKSYGEIRPKDTINASSLAFLIQYKDFKYFSGGDLEGDQETRLLGQLGRLSAFKLSHHGSRFSTSQQFLEATRPGLAFISCGQPDSPAPDLKHPSEFVLENLNNTSSIQNVFSTSFAAPKGKDISNYFARGCADQCARKFKVAGYTDPYFNIIQYGDIILRSEGNSIFVDFYDSSPSYRAAGTKRGFTSLKYSINGMEVSR